MAVINRISRLFRADFHAVLDHVEEPELMLRQAIREMQDDLGARENRIRIAANEQAEIEVRKRESTKALDDIEEQIDLCFESGKPELARNFVRRKLETERHARYLASRETAGETYLREQRAMLDQHRMTLDGLRQKAEIFTRRSREPAGNGPGTKTFGFDPHIGDDEVEVEFIRQLNKRRTA
jgi:phage shock protein A